MDEFTFQKPFSERGSGLSGGNCADPRVLATADIFGETLAEQGSRMADLRVVGMGEGIHPVVDRFAERCPDQYFCLDLQSDMAKRRVVEMAGAGSVVFLVAGNSGTVAKIWPFLRDEVCRKRLNIKLVAACSGISAPEDCVSPEVVEDMALMRVLPRMKVIVPADATETRRVLNWALETHAHAYIRLSTLPVRGVTRAIDHFEPGRAIVLNPGWDIALMACGPLVSLALDTAEELELDRITARVLNFSTIKPIDRAAVVETSIDTRRIITLEEHQITGGLGSAVAEIIAREGCGGRICMMGLYDECLAHLPTKDLQRHYGLTVGRLVEIAKELIAAVP